MGRSGARAIVIMLTLVALGLIGWRTLAPRPTEPALLSDAAAGLSRVLMATFAGTSALKVATLSGTVRAGASDVRLGGLLASDQLLEAPYSVDYFVDLSRLTARDYRWTPATRTLELRVPDVVAARPNIDAARFQVKRRGLFITRDAYDAMTRAGATRASALVTVEANTPARMGQARNSARAALARLLGPALAAAGRRDMAIAVRFATDGGDVAERWDESRSLATILQANAAQGPPR